MAWVSRTVWVDQETYIAEKWPSRVPRWRVGLLWVFALLVTPQTVGAEGMLTQVHHDFTQDPGWEGLNNWVECQQPLTKTQDFGWSRTQHASRHGSGEIGGRIWNSTTPASYGMPIGPFGFKQPLSASGTIAIRGMDPQSAPFLGFYNSQRQGWRPLSSMMFAFLSSKISEKQRDDPTPGVQPWFTVVSSSWRQTGLVTDNFIPADGTVHRWRFDYDPDARIDLNWPHPNLPKYFAALGARASMDAVMEIASQLEPGISREQVRQRLDAASNQSLIVFDPRRGTDYWEKVFEPEKHRGAVTVQIDDESPVRAYLLPGFIDEPMEMNRFGVINMQTYGNRSELYIGDLVVNGYHVDLSHDPGWDGRGNRVTIQDRDFHSRQRFGFVPSNRAGEAPGEIGGHFWRSEPMDPLHAFYADDVGHLSLDDPLSFGGNICFVDGQPDSAFMVGYFNRAKRTVPLEDEASHAWRDQFFGFIVDGPSRIGYFLMPFLQVKEGMHILREEQKFQPDGKRRRFHFDYDPRENDGNGRITVRLDESTFHLDVPQEVRREGARFDHFGIMNSRIGGKMVQMYLDDLSYTARRDSDYQPRRYSREVRVVPYPDGGRAY